MADPMNSLAGKRVLIAEDEPLIAVDHRSVLSEAGALQCLDSAPVDVAVVDYLLADRNSEPLQAALKRRQIPFVVVSSYPRPLVRTEEGQEVLRKPVMPHQLRCSVAAAVRRRRAA